MFRKAVTSLKRPRSARKDTAAPLLPAGVRIYAIGDIHGRKDLLLRMRELIAADVATAKPAQAAIVFLGDYIDRGPDSPGVLDVLSAGSFPAETVPLLGNHEAMLLRFLDAPAASDAWRRNGGIETAYSYGVDLTDFRAKPDLEDAVRQLRAAIPERHLLFLRSLALSYRAGGYFFCHAGVRPGVALERQRDTDLLWIRDEFLASREAFGAMVVHGHTPSEEPLVRANAIGIDTGAYITGRLTCAILSAEPPVFLST